MGIESGRDKDKLGSIFEGNRFDQLLKEISKFGITARVERGMFTVNPKPFPFPTSLAEPVPG